MEEEYNFITWTTQELFDHLIDLGVIPYEEEFEEWRFLKQDMLNLCINTLNHD